MRNTYINETYDIAYPLFGTGALPFPMSVLTGASICIKGARSSDPVAITHLSLRQDGVTVNISRGSQYIGSFTFDNPEQDKSAVLSSSGAVDAIGNLTIGIVPEDCYGDYDGLFELDPSCVLYMTDAQYARYSSLSVDGTVYELDKTLVLAAEGAGSIVGRTVTGESSSMTAELSGYTMVTKVNGLDVCSDTGTVLLIESVSDAVEFRYAECGGESTSIVLCVDGTKAFPNCYLAKNDEARV